MDFVINSFTNIRILDILDILIIAYLAYKFLFYIRETSAKQLLKGVLIVLFIWLISEFLSFNMLNYLIKNLMTLGIITLVIVFQPELRLGLEKLGRGQIVNTNFSDSEIEETNENLNEIIEAVDYLSKRKTGAIIVLEQETGLKNISDTGVQINANINRNLIKNIFFKNAPLHDGALLIKDDRIIAAACLLPLSSNRTISKDLGTRHRAALGISERSDAFVIVVSEETGIISTALEGKLSRFVELATLESVIRTLFAKTKKPLGLANILQRNRKWLKKSERNLNL